MTYPRQPSIYLAEEHAAFRKTVAAFVDREIRPHAENKFRDIGFWNCGKRVT